MELGSPSNWLQGMQAEELSSVLPQAPPTAGDLPPLAVSRQEAASMLAIGIDSLDAHVLPAIRTLRLGRRVLIPVKELQDWIEREALCVGAGW